MRRVAVDLWWADLTAADISLAATLPERERERLSGISDQAGRARRLLGALLLQRAIRYARRLPDGAVVEIDRTCTSCGRQHGRPTAADGSGPHLSVAHSGLLVVVATCSSAAVGVDVERIVPGSERLDAWVAREARFKAGLLGSGDHAEPDEGALVNLVPPLPGHVAAVAVAAPAGTATSLSEHFEVTDAQPGAQESQKQQNPL